MISSCFLLGLMVDTTTSYVKLEVGCYSWFHDQQYSWPLPLFPGWFFVLIVYGGQQQKVLEFVRKQKEMSWIVLGLTGNSRKFWTTWLRNVMECSWSDRQQQKVPAYMTVCFIYSLGKTRDEHTHYPTVQWTCSSHPRFCFLFNDILENKVL